MAGVTVQAERMWDGAREVAGSTRDAKAQWVPESSSLTPKPMLVQQWFSNMSVHPTCLEGLLRHSLQSPASRVFYSVGQRWDQRICIFLNSQVVLPMLLQETHFENCWLTHTRSYLVVDFRDKQRRNASLSGELWPIHWFSSSWETSQKEKLLYMKNKV